MEKLETRFLRFADLLAQKDADEDGQSFVAQEKALGLAAEGFSSFFREKEAP